MPASLPRGCGPQRCGRCWRHECAGRYHMCFSDDVATAAALCGSVVRIVFAVARVLGLAHCKQRWSRAQQNGVRTSVQKAAVGRGNQQPQRRSRRRLAPAFGGESARSQTPARRPQRRQQRVPGPSRSRSCHTPPRNASPNGDSPASSVGGLAASVVRRSRRAGRGDEAAGQRGGGRRRRRRCCGPIPRAGGGDRRPHTPARKPVRGRRFTCALQPPLTRFGA